MPVQKITFLERKVMNDAFKAGLSPKQIAAYFKISLSTFYYYVRVKQK